jgi:hypothetical protein
VAISLKPVAAVVKPPPVVPPASANDNVVIKELADISATTPPATDYSDIVTIVGAGSF